MKENRISNLEVVSYSLTKFSQTLISNTISTFILYFYTDMLLIPAGILSILLLIVRIFDGAIDPLIGYHMDKNITKFGKFKGYMVYFLLPMCILSIVLFFPVNFTGPQLIAWCFIIYILWSFLFSILEESSNALMISITADSSERRKINSVKIFFSITAVLIVNYYVLKVVTDPWDFMKIIAIFSAVALVLNIPCTLFVKERNIYKENTLSLISTIKILLKNCIFLLCILAAIFQNTAIAVKSQAAVYYMKYYVGRVDLISLFMVSGILSSLAAQPFIHIITKKVNYRVCMIWGFVLSCLSMLLVGVSGKNIPMLMVGNILYGLFSAFPANLIYIYMGEIADKSSTDEGGSLSGTIASFIGLSGKVGAAVAGSLIALILELTAYTANTELTEQALFGIRFSFVGLTLILYLGGGIFTFLSHKMMKNNGGESVI